MSNRDQTFKIYEFYVNKNSLFTDTGTDLHIEVTPCNGRVDLYVSDDFIALFNNASHVSPIDVTSFDKFGKTVKRVKNI